MKILLLLILLLGCAVTADAQSAGLGTSPWTGVKARSIAPVLALPTYCFPGSGEVVTLNPTANVDPSSGISQPHFCDSAYHWRPFASWQSQNSSVLTTAVTVDFKTGPVQTFTMSSNISTLTLTNIPDGAHVSFVITQASTGGFTISWPAAVKWPSATPPTLSAAFGKVDVVNCVTVSTNLYCSALLDVR